MDARKGSDRRVMERRHLIFYLGVFDADDGSLLGHLVDVTTGGVMLVSETPVDSGVRLRLKMELPYDDDADMFMEFEGATRWCRPDANPRFYDIGIQFPRLTLKKKGIIKYLIKDYGFMH